jgi:hypothetical protein
MLGMKLAVAVVVALAALSGAGATAQSRLAATKVEARTTLHDDGTKTESVRDPNKHELTETIYNARGVVIGRKIFLLGAAGDPVQGVIKDGMDHVIANAQFFYDDLGRLIEERCSNTQGEIFQRTIHKYDHSGRALPAEVHNYQVRAANMRPAKIDFTQGPAARNPASSVAVPQPVQPGSGPRIHTVSPTTGQEVDVPTGQPLQPGVVPQAQQEPPKEEKKRSKLNPLNWFRK